jgi:hypothetical protein
MALAFQAHRVNFDSTSGIKQRQPGSVNFPSRVVTANCVLRGYKMKFTNGDHPIHEMEIDIDGPSNSQINGT